MREGDGVRALITGALAGIAGGLFGVGGGIILVPLLTAWLRISQHQAHGTSLAAIAGTALASLVVYGAHARVSWGTALAVGVASTLTARLGARAAARTSPRGLTASFAVFVALVGLRLLWRVPEVADSAVVRGIPAIGIALLIGTAVGLLSGFMGVGGGIIAVPAFTLLLGMPQQTAQGTSLAIVLVTAPAGAIEHARHGNVARGLVLWLALGAALGGPAGSWLAQRLTHDVLTRTFAAFMLVNAVLLGLRSARMGSKPVENHA